MAGSGASPQKFNHHLMDCRFFREESGQVLPWVVLLMLLFLGMSALVVDVGQGVLVQRELQASTDAAALAAASVMPATNYATVAQNYSAMAGSKNTYGGLSVGTPVVTGLCLTTVATWGLPCTSTSPNAVSVTETATIPTFFAGILGMHFLTVSATSTASKGSKPKPYNLAIVLDTTPSMDTPDPNCVVNGKTLTQLQCASNAFQEFLTGFDPSLDSISLFTFPNVTTTTASNDYDCTSGNPTVGPYTFPSATATSLSTMPYSVTTTTTTGSWPNQHTTTTTTTVQETYQVTGFSTDYRTSDSATTLNNKSNLANAVGGSNCQGIQTSYENTYYAGAIYAAQAALNAQAQANKGTENAILFLSDGNATAKVQTAGGAFSPGTNDMVSSSSQSTSYATNSGTYPSWVGECSQGVDAANYAKSQGTEFYVIAYGSPTTSDSSDCASDRSSSATHRNITPCQAMQQMSSGTSYFYSDYFGGNNGCAASGAAYGIGNLAGIVDAILGQMTGARLIPNGTP
jgi:Flp pilus assembly protein TadG